MSAAAYPLPTALADAEAVDPFTVEPGVLLFDGRFCVVEPVTFHAESWCMVVSDVERELGDAPHHRLRVHHLSADANLAAKLRLAAAVDSRIQEYVHHWISQPSGALLVTHTSRRVVLSQPLSSDDAAQVAGALADLLSRLHDAGVVGVRFKASQLHLTRDHVTLAGFEHLLASGSAIDDVVSLTNLLSEIGGQTLASVLRPVPPTAKLLLDRVRTLHRQPVERVLAEMLPSRPPFVARETALRSMLRHFESARRGEAQVIGIVGDEGMGKSRLLEQLGDELRRYAPCIATRTSVGKTADARFPGFVGALDQLARDLLLGSLDEQRSVSERIRQAAGLLTNLIASLSPGLSRLLGSETAPPRLHLDEQFVRHASTIAAVLRAIGTVDNPFVILMDDAQDIDTADLAIMRYLLDESQSHHTLVVACSRAPIPYALDAVIPTLYPLTAFSVSEIERVVSAILPGQIENRREVAQALWKHSRGVPLAVWATIQGWTEEGYLAYRDPERSWYLDGSPSQPSGVVDLFLHHYRRLSLDARYLGLLTSIQSTPVTRTALAEITTWPTERVNRATYDLVSRGVAMEEPGGRIRMPHGALAEMIRNASGQRRLQSAHRQVARWLHERGSSELAQLAWHEEHATPPGRNEELCSWHVEAGGQLMAVYNIDRSRWHYSRARERTEAQDLDVDAVEGLADIELLNGHVDEALAHYLDAMDRAGSTERSLQIASKAVYGFYRRGATSHALTLGRGALKQAGEPTPQSGVAIVFQVLLTVLTLWRPSRQGTAERDALCKLYPVLAAICSGTTPSLLMLYVARGSYHARGLDTPNAATAMMFAAQGLAVLGSIIPPLRSIEHRLVDRATELANHHSDPWAIGVVHHMRGTVEFNDGQWQTGQTSMDLAVSAFARSGDMTIGVLSLLTRAMHTYDRDHADRVLNTLRRAEVSAVRQRAQDAICMAGALRAVIMARRGDPSAEALTDSLLARLDAIDEPSISVSLAYGYLARSLYHLGRLTDGLDRANQGARGVGRFPNMSFLMEPLMARLQILLARSASRPSEWWTLRKELFLVWVSVRRSPGQLANWSVLAGRADLLRGNPDAARAHFERVIGTGSVHRESYAIMQAHLHLASLTEATDPANAEAHHIAGQGYANQLGLQLPDWGASHHEERPEETPIEHLPPVPSTQEMSIAPVASVAGPLFPALEETLPAEVAFTTEIQPGLGFAGNADRFQLLMVNMVFAARDLLPGAGSLALHIREDTLKPHEAAAIEGASAGTWTLVEVRAEGLQGPAENIGGWGVCDEIAKALDGCLHVESSGTSARLVAFLPATTSLAAPRSSRMAAADAVPEAAVLVVHSDPRVRATVAASIAQLGLPVEEVADPDAITREQAIHALAAFVQDSEAAVVERRIQRAVVRLVPRGHEQPANTRSLRVPFVFGDLATLVEDLGLMDDDEDPDGQ